MFDQLNQYLFAIFNSSPGLEGIEKATGVDVADSIIRFIERNARPGRTGTRGKG